ncbi:MAG TPA: hypothetical protein VI542_08805 [Candidatus Tectomicrobia bacterium]
MAPTDVAHRTAARPPTEGPLPLGGDKDEFCSMELVALFLGTQGTPTHSPHQRYP